MPLPTRNDWLSNLLSLSGSFIDEPKNKWLYMRLLCKIHSGSKNCHKIKYAGSTEMFSKESSMSL